VRAKATRSAATDASVTTGRGSAAAIGAGHVNHCVATPGGRRASIDRAARTAGNRARETRFPGCAGGRACDACSGSSGSTGSTGSTEADAGKACVPIGVKACVSSGPEAGASNARGATFNATKGPCATCDSDARLDRA
jgi:hypothetical protein